MKHTRKLILVLAAAALIFTGCKKNSITPAAGTTDNGALSKQVALGLFNAMSGQYGGASMINGANSQSGMSLNPEGPRVTGTNPYCGYTIDTTLSYTNIVAGVSKSVYSHFKFIYTCSTHALDGYILSDSIANTDKGAHFINQNITNQNYIVSKYGSGFNVVLIRGTTGTSSHYTTFNSSQTTIGYNYADSQYTLNGLVVDLSNPTANIISGTATFSSTVKNLGPTTPANGTVSAYTGTIEFLGNHTAKITLVTGGSSYVNIINLLTGELNAVK
jgi:hypothetical protein